MEHHPRGHRFASNRSLGRLRLASLLVLFLPWLSAAPVVLAVWGMGGNQRDLLIASLVLIGVLVICALFLFAISLSIHCPLCHASLFRRTGVMMNSKHRRTLLGSTRFRIATDVLFSSRFRCPYCGEPCDVREARHHRH